MPRKISSTSYQSRGHGCRIATGRFNSSRRAHHEPAAMTKKISSSERSLSMACTKNRGPRSRMQTQTHILRQSTRRVGSDANTKGPVKYTIGLKEEKESETSVECIGGSRGRSSTRGRIGRGGRGANGSRLVAPSLRTEYRVAGVLLLPQAGTCAGAL